MLVSGIFFKGIPGRVVELWLEGAFEVYATPLIMQEYLRVIKELASKAAEDLVRSWQEILPNRAHLIPDASPPLRVVRDPDDDKFISCALQVKADYLVTGDRDLTSLEAAYPFIISPRRFLSILS